MKIAARLLVLMILLWGVPLTANYSEAQVRDRVCEALCKNAGYDGGTGAVKKCACIRFEEFGPLVIVPAPAKLKEPKYSWESDYD